MAPSTDRLSAEAAMAADNAANVLSEALRTVRDSHLRLQSDLAQLRRQLAILARDARHDTALGAAIEELQSELNVLARTVTWRSRRTVRAAERVIQQRPLTAILVTFVSGIVMARLLWR